MLYKINLLLRPRLSLRVFMCLLPVKLILQKLQHHHSLLVLTNWFTIYTLITDNIHNTNQHHIL